MDLKELTKELWHTYFLGCEQRNYEALHLLDPDCVIIGTGRHEFYKNVQDFLSALSAEMNERKDLELQFRDFWCEEKPLTPEVSLVYGSIHIWWESDDRRVCINMDSRFSILYQKIGGVWRVIHIHQSSPNTDQAEGEFYIKTLCAQIEQSQAKIERLSHLAQCDSLTGLMNYRTFQEQYPLWPWEAAWLFVVDLDNFKQVNDTYGHLSGNRALQKISHILASAIRAGDLVCRLGGDEFVLLCSGLHGESDAATLAQRLLDQTAAGGAGELAWTSISIGVAPIGPGEPLDAVLNRADSALYAAKQAGKHRYVIAGK